MQTQGSIHLSFFSVPGHLCSCCWCSAKLSGHLMGVPTPLYQTPMLQVVETSTLKTVSLGICSTAVSSNVHVNLGRSQRQGTGVQAN